MKTYKALFLASIIVPFFAKAVIQNKSKNFNLNDGSWYEVKMYTSTHEFNYFRVKQLSSFRYTFEAVYETGDSGAIKDFLLKTEGNILESYIYKELWGKIQLEEFKIHVEKNIMTQMDEDVNTIYLINRIKKNFF